MKFLRILALATGLLWCMSLHAELVTIQEAIEAHDIKIKMHDAGKGYVLARSCATCRYKRLDIDRKTSVTVDGKPVKAGKRLDKQWSGGIVIYDVKTNQVVRLKL